MTQKRTVPNSFYKANDIPTPQPGKDKTQPNNDNKTNYSPIA